MTWLLSYSLKKDDLRRDNRDSYESGKKLEKSEIGEHKKVGKMGFNPIAILLLTTMQPVCDDFVTI
jgi:hypothetical protein